MGWKGISPEQFAENAKAKLMAVPRLAVEELAEELTRTTEEGGRVPVEHGNLARSLLAQTGSPPTAREIPTGGFTAQAIGPVLLDWQPEHALYLGYQAAYARRMNFGFVGTDSLGRAYNQPGHHFVEAAVAKWPAIVARVTARVRHGGAE
jgi:hypothetical protein